MEATQTTDVSASLQCTVNGRNAEYHAKLEQVDGGFLLAVQYGAIGATLQSTKKPAKPVSFEKALALMTSVIKEKTNKGYVYVTSGAPADQVGGPSNGKESSAHRPQLLNEIDESSAQKLLLDSKWGMQEKKDGKRIALEMKDGQCRGINKLGLYCNVPSEVVDAAMGLGATSALIDGELIGQTLFAFDLLELNGLDMSGYSCIERHAKLKQLLVNEVCETPRTKEIQFVDFSRMHGEASAIMGALRDDEWEGFVLKRLASTYSPGRPNSGGDQLKFKFTQSVSAICLGANGDKRSIALKLLDKDGSSVGVGNVTIPVNQNIPKEGEVVEVRFLYYFKGGSLFQPVYLGARDDILPEECLLSQITRFAPVNS